MKRRKCKKRNRVIFKDELSAKIVLAERQKKDKGEIRVYRCGNHFHLTSMPLIDSSVHQ